MENEKVWDRNRVREVRVSVINNRTLRRVMLVLLYPVLTLWFLALLPYAVVRKIVLHQIELFQSTVRVWRLP